MCSASLAPFLPLRRDVLPSMAITLAGVPVRPPPPRPRNSAGTPRNREKGGVKSRKKITQVVMRRRTVVEGPKAAQKLKLLLANRTFREEFYACRDLIADSIGAMRFELRKAVEKYNAFRPHHALKGKTPMEYLRTNQAEAA